MQGIPGARRGTALIGLIVLLSVPSLAQSGKSGKAGKEEEPFEFDRAESPGKSPSKKPAGNEELTPQKALERSMPSLITWPSESGKNAARALAARGPEEMLAPCRWMLATGTVRERTAVSRVLCLLGDRESLPAIEELLMDRRISSLSAEILLSIADLDRGHAEKLGLKLLASNSLPLRKAAAHLLHLQAGPEAIEQVHRLMANTDSHDVRLACFELARRWNRPELVGLALNWVGHNDSRLAREVASYLSWRKEPHVLAQLVETAEQDRDRPGLYAWLILAGHELHYGDPVLPESLFPTLLSDTRSSDPLLRAAAAVACASIGYRSEEYAAATREKVLPALVDGVIRPKYFSDFDVCFDHSVAQLEKLTGQRLGKSVPAWREYWYQYGSKDFQPKGELQAMRIDVDAPYCTLVLERADGHGRWQSELILMGENFRARISQEGRPVGLILPVNVMQDVLQRVKAGGFFDSELPRELVEVPAGTLRFTLEVRSRERSLMAAETDAAMGEWADILRTRAWPYYWQQLLGDENYLELYNQEEAWWASHSDVAERVRRVLDLALLQLESSSARVQEVLQLVIAVPRVERFASPEQLQGLATHLASLGRRDDVSRTLLGLLIGTQREEAYFALLRAYAPLGPVALPLLEQVIGGMGRSREALRDPRAIVRLASLRDMEVRGAAAPEEVRAVATSDPDSTVRRKAFELLARSPDAAAQQQILEMAQNGSPDIRPAALRALGRLANDRALEILSAALDSENLELVQAAIEGLGLERSEVGARHLEAFVLRMGSENVRGVLALAQLRGMPGALALESLFRLSEASDPQLAREARYGLADLGDLSVVSFLLDELEDTASHRRAMGKLQYLFCRDESGEPFRYRLLAEAHPDWDHQDFLRAALQVRNPDVPDDLDLRSREAWPVLIEALNDERWYVRRAALQLLENTTGQSFGILSVSATEEDRAQAAQRWREYLSGLARED